MGGGGRWVGGIQALQLPSLLLPLAKRPRTHLLLVRHIRHRREEAFVHKDATNPLVDLYLRPICGLWVVPWRPPGQVCRLCHLKRVENIVTARGGGEEEEEGEKGEGDEEGEAEVEE